MMKERSRKPASFFLFRRWKSDKILEQNHHWNNPPELNEPPLAQSTEPNHLHHNKPPLAQSTEPNHLHHNELPLAQSTEPNHLHHNELPLVQSTEPNHLHHNEPPLAQSTEPNHLHHNELPLAQSTEPNLSSWHKPRSIQNTSRTIHPNQTSAVGINQDPYKPPLEQSTRTKPPPLA
jgi:hypothetical protein